MNTIKRYCTAWKRFCRSRGFGIHSPFAYNFVVDVISQRLPYYAYEELELMHHAVASDNRCKRVMSLENAKLLFRVTNHFNPRHILQIGSNYGLSAAATLLPFSHSRLWLYEPDAARHTTLDTTLYPFASRIVFDDSIVNITANYTAATEEARHKPFVVINNIHNAESFSQVQFFVNSVLDGEGVIVFRNIDSESLIKQLWEDSRQYASHGMSFGNYRTAVFVSNSKLPRQDFTLWM
ncbi:MAG: hypothetical protein ACI4AH_04160 [Muribaculaceae bacterium]